jgi:hypothetical protein
LVYLIEFVLLFLGGKINLVYVFECMDGWMDGREVPTTECLRRTWGKTRSGYPKKKRVSKEEEEGKAVSRTNSAT